MTRSKKELEKYVHKLLESQEKSAELSTEERKEIALSLGLTETDWDRIQRDYKNNIVRGHNFLDLENWEDAAHEFSEAFILEPQNEEVLFGLAKAYEGRYWDQFRSEDKVAAERYARQILISQPGHQEAAALISRLKKSNQPKHKGRHSLSRKRKGTKIFFAALVLLSTGIGLGLFLYTGDAPQPAPVEIPPPPTPEEVPSTSASSVQIPQFELDPTVKLLPSSKSSSLTFFGESSTISDFSDAFSYKLKGYFINEDFETNFLRLNLEFFDQEGKLLFSDQVNALEKHNPVARNKDVIAFDYLEYQKRPAPEIAEVRMEVETIEQVASSVSYEPSPLLEFAWQYGKPANMGLEIRERMSNLNTSYPSKGFTHRLQLELKNIGQLTIRQLQIRIDRFDKEQTILGSKDLFVVINDHAPLLKEMTRIYGTSEGFSNQSPDQFGGYQITVLSAE